MNKFIPLSPDPFIVKDDDMPVARFGHINALVDVINAFVPSTSGIMYQSQYDPTNSGIVNNSYQFNSKNPAFYLDRANHTGLQAQSTIINLVSDLASKGDMFKNVYDTNNDGIVNNSSLLNSQPGSYYLNRANHTGVQSQATILNLTSDLALKEDKANKGAANGYCELDGAGKVPLARLNLSLFNLQNSWDANLNLPPLADGVGTLADTYIVGFPGTQNLGSGPITFAIGDLVVYGASNTWQKISAVAIGVTSVNGYTNTVNLTADDILTGSTNFFVTQDILDALVNSPTLADASNPYITLAEYNALNSAISLKGDMLKSVYDANNNGKVDDSDRLAGQLPAYYLNRANHTGLQPQSSITNLLTDLGLKEDKANKGIPNGYCELDATGKVPASRINLSMVNYINTWNAFTNTPFISDGIGAAGDGYIVGVAGTRNLGSGNINFAVGDQVILSSSLVWQKVTATGPGVVSVNGSTGVVNLVTDNVPATVTNAYVTQVQKDALNNPLASSSNKFVTQSELNIIVGQTYLMPENFSDGKTLGNGTIQYLNTLGYNNTTASTAFPRVAANYSMNVNTMDIDWISLQEMSLFQNQTGANAVTFPGGKGYCPSRTIEMPKDQAGAGGNRRALQFIYNFNGAAFTNLTGTNFIMWNVYPVDQTEANGLRLVYQYTMRDAYFYGNNSANANDVAIRIGARSHVNFHNLGFSSFGINADLQFALECQMTNIRSNDFGIYGIRLIDGLWPGSGVNIAQSNDIRITSYHSYSGTGKTPIASVYCQGNRNITLESPTFEGDNGSQHHIYYNQKSDSTSSYCATCANTIRVLNADFENAGASQSAIRLNIGGGQALIDTFNIQQDPAVMPVFVEHTTTLSGVPVHIKVKNASYSSQPYNPWWKFRNTSTAARWYIEQVALNDNSNVYAAANWSLTGGGIIPTSVPQRVYYVPII